MSGQVKLVMIRLCVDGHCAHINLANTFSGGGISFSINLNSLMQYNSRYMALRNLFSGAR